MQGKGKNARFVLMLFITRTEKRLIQFQLFISYETRLFTEKCSRTTTIHSGIFGGRALWADTGPPRMNTIASRDQFKPIRIGENLVVNYKSQ